uniref:Enoyl reductase (ER) domain-containing protein n=1 Tax=Pyrodinium bahamense TaxID=73915 RepID=A0A7R9ZYN0_9DINO|mmetsp:Transcript_15473/g.42708  ORF Transcript_15473/g.42708 Transcript_15473/m.42708 type:complete len:345 (+) Transcript_15473:54-1088(+)|eukprot:CAMPEP_0179096460 /NCGR_PEP_ID=MMETSP0796-20121207/44345_1 /TAXON_ID=73915 /ORGANISM="Pyrodinium bahamense, Strain pbaha01" /LENGTH=344 /DNA_ID=CAMNT_0020794179 /DNA_START=18 /DNA_END=1052 /DNA_ORIENTATION=-
MFALTLADPKKKRLEVVAVDEPGPLEEDELLVRMEYSSVQHLDSELAGGGRGVEPPQVMGTDGVGIVLQSRCPAIPVGVHVGFIFFRVPQDLGSWCTLVKLSHARACIVELPRDVALQEAAGGLSSSLMALACLRHFGHGAVVLVSGACGAVGLALLQLAAIRGMKAVGLVRGAARTAWIMKELGATRDIHAIDVSSPGWSELATEVCGSSVEGDCGADGVIDGVGGELLTQVLESGLVRARGAVVAYGCTAGPPDEGRVASAAKVRGLRRLEEGMPEALARADAAAQLGEALVLMTDGKYRPRVWQNVKWSDAGHCLVPQPSWSKYISQYTEGRIGRIILKFD